MHRFSILLLLSPLLLNTTFGANITKDCPSLSQFKNGEVEQLSAFKRKLSCNKGYTLYGPQYIYCTDRGVWIPEVPSCIKSGCPNLPINQNVRFSEGKQKGSIKSFSCNPTFILSGADRVLCDGTRWSGVSPNCVKYDTLTRNFTCDFEDKGFCGWIQDINDDFDWTRWSGKTLSDATGPSSDHTGNPNGHYIYIETTDILRNSKAFLMSPTFPPFKGINTCVEFWYHSFGRNAGALRVHLKPTSPKGKPLVIFDRDGLNNDTWFRGFAEIRAQQYTYNILFEATVGGAFGDIALDDLNIYNCKVPTPPPVKGVKPTPRKPPTLTRKTQSKGQLPTTKPTTKKLTTAKPTTTKLTTAKPTTAVPTTAEPTTAEPTTTEPTTAEPTTAEPTTEEPTTAEPAQTSASSTETASMEIASTDDTAGDTTIRTTGNVSSSSEINIKEEFKNLYLFIVTVVMAAVAVALTVSTTVACYRYYSTVKRRTKNNYDELDIRLNERAFYHTPKLTDPVQTPSNVGARPRDVTNQSLRVSSSPRQPMETEANPYSEIRDMYNN